MRLFEKISMLLLFLILINFFYLKTYNLNKSVGYILIICSIVFIFYFKKIIHMRRGYSFNFIVLSFLIIYLVEVIASLIINKQGLKDVILVSFNNIVLLSYYIFSYNVIRHKNIKKFELSIIIITALLSGLFIIQFFLYDKGVIFLNITPNLRFDSLRITDAAIFINIGLILSFSNFINSYNKLRYRLICLIATILSYFHVIVIEKTRAIVGIITFCLIIMTIFKYRKKIIKITISGLVILSILLILSTTSVFVNYVKSYDENDISFVARQKSTVYYTSIIKENPFFALGFINPHLEDTSFTLLRGPEGVCYRDDVGIIGFGSTFGILGIGWYLALLVKFVKIIKENIKSHLINNYLELLGLFVFILLSSVTMIIMDPQRIIMLPVILAIYDYTHQINGEINKTNAKPAYATLIT